MDANIPGIDVEFAANLDPRCACILLVDTSGSMQGGPLDQLNQGLQTFAQALREDSLARKRIEVAIITFGNNHVQMAQDFVLADAFFPPTLTPGGQTPMGAAINLALDALQTRKATYTLNGVAFYRPWIFLITDGAPTDEWQSAAQRVKSEESQKKVAFFAVGVEQANMEILKQITPRTPLHLKGLAFREMFVWLSRSMTQVSHSHVGDEVPLESPAGWGAV